MESKPDIDPQAVLEYCERAPAVPWSVDDLHRNWARARTDLPALAREVHGDHNVPDAEGAYRVLMDAVK